MKINTKKIQMEMARSGISIAQLARMIKPPRTRQAAAHIIEHGKTFSVVEQIAKVLNMDPKDLII